MSSDVFTNTIVALIGFAGTGKYTIGRELCERTGAKLIDNHLIANPIFSVVNVDGITPLPDGVWARLKQIRRTVYDAIRELSPPEMSFVFTVEWRANNPEDYKSFADLAELAALRHSRFVPIRLICGVEELCRRVTDPARAAMLKELSPELARKKSLEDEVLHISHPNQRTLDVTKRTASGNVDAILDEISSIKSVSDRSLTAGGSVDRN
jgi:hypothetical protein